MATIKLSQAFVDLMKKKHLDQKTLLLITDDGGGRYSLQGGACSIGTKFTLIVLDQPDSDYQVKLENDAGLDLYTSDYDMIFFASGLAMDFQNGRSALRMMLTLIWMAVFELPMVQMCWQPSKRESWLAAQLVSKIGAVMI